MRQLKRLLVSALLATTCSCTSYLVMTSEPRYGGQPHQRPLTSLAGGNGTSPHPGIVASECGEDQLAMVQVTRNLGQALASFVTLGLYAPATVRYYCATPAPPPIGNSGSGGGR